MRVQRFQDFGFGERRVLGKVGNLLKSLTVVTSTEESSQILITALSRINNLTVLVGKTAKYKNEEGNVTSGLISSVDNDGILTIEGEKINVDNIFFDSAEQKKIKEEIKSNPENPSINKIITELRSEVRGERKKERTIRREKAINKKLDANLQANNQSEVFVPDFFEGDAVTIQLGLEDTISGTFISQSNSGQYFVQVGSYVYQCSKDQITLRESREDQLIKESFIKELNGKFILEELRGNTIKKRVDENIVIDFSNPSLKVPVSVSTGENIGKNAYDEHGVLIGVVAYNNKSDVRITDESGEEIQEKILGSDDVWIEYGDISRDSLSDKLSKKAIEVVDGTRRKVLEKLLYISAGFGTVALVGKLGVLTKKSLEAMSDAEINDIDDQDLKGFMDQLGKEIGNDFEALIEKMQDPYLVESFVFITFVDLIAGTILERSLLTALCATGAVRKDLHPKIEEIKGQRKKNEAAMIENNFSEEEIEFLKTGKDLYSRRKFISFKKHNTQEDIANQKKYQELESLMNLIVEENDKQENKFIDELLRHNYEASNTYKQTNHFPTRNAQLIFLLKLHQLTFCGEVGKGLAVHSFKEATIGAVLMGPLATGLIGAGIKSMEKKMAEKEIILDTQILDNHKAIIEKYKSEASDEDRDKIDIAKAKVPERTRELMTTFCEISGPVPLQAAMAPFILSFGSSQIVREKTGVLAEKVSSCIFTVFEKYSVAQIKSILDELDDNIIKRVLSKYINTKSDDFVFSQSDTQFLREEMMTEYGFGVMGAMDSCAIGLADAGPLIGLAQGFTGKEALITASLESFNALMHGFTESIALAKRLGVPRESILNKDTITESFELMVKSFVNIFVEPLLDLLKKSQLTPQEAAAIKKYLKDSFGLDISTDLNLDGVKLEILKATKELFGKSAKFFISQAPRNAQSDIISMLDGIVTIAEGDKFEISQFNNAVDNESLASADAAEVIEDIGGDILESIPFELAPEAELIKIKESLATIKKFGSGVMDAEERSNKEKAWGVLFQVFGINIDDANITSGDKKKLATSIAKYIPSLEEKVDKGLDQQSSVDSIVSGLKKGFLDHVNSKNDPSVSKAQKKAENVKTKNNTAHAGEFNAWHDIFGSEISEAMWVVFTQGLAVGAATIELNKRVYNTDAFQALPQFAQEQISIAIHSFLSSLMDNWADTIIHGNQLLDGIVAPNVCRKFDVNIEELHLREATEAHEAFGSTLSRFAEFYQKGTAKLISSGASDYIIKKFQNRVYKEFMRVKHIACSIAANGGQYTVLGNSPHFSAFEKLMALIMNVKNSFKDMGKHPLMHAIRMEQSYGMAHVLALIEEHLRGDHSILSDYDWNGDHDQHASAIYEKYMNMGGNVFEGDKTVA